MADLPAVVETHGVQTHRTAASRAQAEDTLGAANRAYAAELAALRDAREGSGDLAVNATGRGAVTVANPATGALTEVAPFDAAELDAAFGLMGRWDGWAGGSSRALRARWGSDANANMGYAMAFADSHGDIAEVIACSGLAGHPAVIEIAALLGRRYAAHGRTPEAARGVSWADDAHETDTEDRLRALRTAIAEAQARGETRRAARLYRDELALIAARRGSRAIVGGGRTA